MPSAALSTVLVGLLPVALAGGLGVVRRPQVVAVLGGIALGAVLVVVALELLPGAVGALGPAALLATLVGFLVPAGLERLLAHHAGAWLAAVGVAAHQLLHGAEVGALADRLGAAGLMAASAHALPLVALVLIDAREAWGLRAATALWSALMVLTAIGLVAGSAWPIGRFVQGDLWLQALIAGTLLHVTLHSRREGRRLPMISGVVVGVVGASALVWS
jgi:hypothetical protein